MRHAEDTLTALLGGHEALAYLAALRDGQILQENECEHYAAQIAEAGAAWETVLEGVSFEDLSQLRRLLREVDEYTKDGGELFNGFQHETERRRIGWRSSTSWGRRFSASARRTTARSTATCSAWRSTSTGRWAS